MNILQFAHNGVEHASAAEAEAHNASQVLAIIAIIVIAVAVIIGLARYMSRPEKITTKEETKED